MSEELNSNFFFAFHSGVLNMNIENLLPDGAFLRLKSVDGKESLIEKLVEAARSSYLEEHPQSPESADSFLNLVKERESSCSTGMGGGVAFPHARVPGLLSPIVAIAVVEDGVDFGAPDGKPVRIAVLFLFPGHRYDLGVKIQAAFARFLSNESNFKAMLELGAAGAARSLFAESGMAVDAPIMASDLMRAPKIKITEKTPLREATHLMKRFRTEVAPVLDDEGALVGEVDCIHLFQKELPDYIKELRSVPSIQDFDPFSKYFTEDADITVGEVINREVAKVASDGSLIEIIFLLTVRKHSLVHVCDDGKLVGVIDRITVLDKVFNL